MRYLQFEINNHGQNKFEDDSSKKCWFLDDVIKLLLSGDCIHNNKPKRGIILYKAQKFYRHVRWNSKKQNEDSKKYRKNHLIHINKHTLPQQL